MSEQNKSALSLNLLLWVLVAIALAILYQQFARPEASLREIISTPVNLNTPNYQNHEEAFNDFLMALQQKKDLEKAHHNLSAYFISLEEGELPTRTELRNYLKQVKLPADYQYFFEECLLAFTQPSIRKGTRLSGENILVSLPAGSPYEATYIVNQDAVDVNKINDLIDLKGSEFRLVLSGTYTSPLGMPVGLNVLRGEVINPAIQKFDGLILLDREGQISLTHIDHLEYNLKPYRIRSSFSDYKSFLQKASKDRLSVLQSHLILNHGNILIQDNANGRKMRRRVLFATSDGGIHIYDSFEKDHSLFDAAKFVKDTYAAQIAINLDMGDFNFCTLNTPERFKNYSQLKAGTVLSNFLIIDF